MAGRKRKIDRITYSSPRRPLRPRRRQDISEIPEPEQSRLRTLADAVREVIAKRGEDGTIPEHELELAAFALEIAPYEVLKLIGQFEAYHETYVNQHPANAFTPVLPGKVARRGRAVSPVDIGSDVDSSSAPPPRKRPHIMSVTDRSERERIIHHTARIVELVALQAANNNRLPDGELDTVAVEWNVTPNWVAKQMRHLRAYRAAYSNDPTYNDANAFTPLPIGRQPGRKVQPKIKEAIEKATVNREWPSFNGDGTVTEIKNQPLGPRPIYSLICQTYGEDAPSETTVWRIFNDYREAHPARFAVNRVSDAVLQKILPWIKNSTGGSWERIQLDVRPLPIVVDYKGILCTLRAILIVDDLSDYKPVWHVLPAVRIDNDQEVHGRDYTCQKIRELVAMAFLRIGKRSRLIYPDNGSIFAKPALGPYMQFLVVPGEHPTFLLNRGRKKPRGGGNVENELGFLDQFLQFRPRYIREEDFRRSLANGKKEKVRTFEQFIGDFDLFMHHNNHDSLDDQPSCFQRFQEGRDRSLSLPSMENLTVFGGSCKERPRSADPGGFWLKKRRYVPARRDPQIYEALADAAAREQKIAINRYQFGEYQMVFFSLDETTWEYAIPKDEDDVVWQQHVKVMQEVEQAMKHEGSEAALFFKTLLSSREKPLVLNGLRKRPRFETLEDAQRDLAEVKASPDRLVMPRDFEDIQQKVAGADADKKNSHKASSSPAKPKRGVSRSQSQPAGQQEKRGRSKTQQMGQPETPRGVHGNQPRVEVPALPDDSDEFLRQLNELLGDGNA